jgi:hypothetical protein
MIQLRSLVRRSSGPLALCLWRSAILTAQVQSPLPTLTVQSLDAHAVTVRTQAPVYVVVALRDRLGNLRLLFPSDSGLWRPVEGQDTLPLQRALPIQRSVPTSPRQCIVDRNTDRVWDPVKRFLEARAPAECGPPREVSSSPFITGYLIIVAVPNEEEPGGLSKVFARYSRTESLLTTTLRFVRGMCPVRLCRDWQAVFVHLP